MNKKTGFFIISTLFIFGVLFSVSLSFAQYWHYCEIDAYGTDLDDFFEHTINANRYEFTVVSPPAGSEITNTIYVINYDTGENYTETLVPGQRVRYNYDECISTLNRVTEAPEGYWTLEYEGDITRVLIDSVDIPEFSTILLVPLFIALTLFAIIYRRKQT